MLTLAESNVISYTARKINFTYCIFANSNIPEKESDFT